MRGSEEYAQFDIVVVPFPYADRLAEKRRPALVVSTPEVAPYDLVWVVMITSATNRGWSCDVPVSDLKKAGLPAPSVVRPVKVACIDPARIVRRAGALDSKAAKKVGEELRSYLGT
jgi:mRNA interferase MazF